ncbi:MAG: hypothetical protein ACJAS1_007147 [Oleiphilaceae bacterium]|jgi:hypothetical protein
MTETGKHKGNTVNCFAANALCVCVGAPLNLRTTNQLLPEALPQFAASESTTTTLNQQGLSRTSTITERIIKLF